MTIQRKPNRRDFVKGSAAAAGAAIAGGLSVARGAHAAGGDQIKIALIGCGGRGTGAASQCLSVPNENIKLIAVADAFEDSAVRSLGILRGRCGDKVDVSPDRVFAGFDAYKKAIDCDADLVLLATPPGFRPMHYKAAIEAGKRVFMEKPVCVDAPGFRSVMETNKLADERGLQVAVGLNSRHTAPVVETIR
jgi:myo-inositol 2-dehydrogenase/D-chiro-inositol 1-dehydrogenase